MSTDHGVIECFRRTFGEAFENDDPNGMQEAKGVIADIIDYYNASAARHVAELPAADR